MQSDGGEKQNRGWAIILTAAAVMLATLPGRTQGLSLITEPLLDDLHFSRITFAGINLWATLIGALFCFPEGWLLDRFGFRWPTTGIILALAIVVLGISRAGASVPLMFALLTATRGLGQSALSVASITAMGKRFGKEPGMPMAVLSILISLFFTIAFVSLGAVIQSAGWRAAWFSVAASLLFIAPLPLAFLKIHAPQAAHVVDETGLSLKEAVMTPAFWVFAGAAASFNLVSSGFGLFNESILLESGFNRDTFHLFLGVTTGLSLVGQFLGGYLSRKISFQALTTVSLALYAIGLAAVPMVRTVSQLMIVASILGISGGMIIVVFFSIWPVAFGKRHLGHIQGAAQFLTVLSSAVGPVLFANVHEAQGSYAPVLYGVAAVVVVVGALAWRARLPALRAENL